MLEDFTHDYILQLCEGVQGRVKVKKKRIDSRYCEECNVERIMYSHLGFYICPSCGVGGDNIFVVGYGESTLMHKKGYLFIREMNIFNRKLGSFYVENLLTLIRIGLELRPSNFLTFTFYLLAVRKI